MMKHRSQIALDLKLANGEENSDVEEKPVPYIYTVSATVP